MKVQVEVSVIQYSTHILEIEADNEDDAWNIMGEMSNRDIRKALNVEGTIEDYVIDPAQFNSPQHESGGYGIRGYSEASGVWN
jgi:hypothetical protein